MKYADDATRLRLADALRSALAEVVENDAADAGLRSVALPPPAGPTGAAEPPAPPAIVSGARSGAAIKLISFSPHLVRAILDGRKTQTRRLVRPVPAAMPDAAKCPIAQPGDRVAVREAWARHEGRYVYAADSPMGTIRFRPAMYMPRDASRLTLRATDVRAERLTALSTDDARAEGCPSGHVDPVAWFAALWDGFFDRPGQRFADDPWVWVIHFRVETQGAA
jgi:hypothetical protein